MIALQVGNNRSPVGPSTQLAIETYSVRCVPAAKITQGKYH